MATAKPILSAAARLSGAKAAARGTIAAAAATSAATLAAPSVPSASSARRHLHAAAAAAVSSLASPTASFPPPPPPRALPVPPHPPRRFLSSDFSPPPPNVYHGTAVYDDIDVASPAPDGAASARRNADPDAVFVVTGASRGMGLQYVRSLLDRAEGRVVALCRDGTEGGAPLLWEFLSSLSPEEAGRVDVSALDVTDQGRVEELTSEVEEKFGRVDGLFNVAGVLGDAASTPGPERGLAKLDRDWLREQMEVNAIGPMMLIKALAPLMRSRKGRKSTRAETVVVNMSARVGSIADNTGGLGWHSYRMSKAALNQGTRTISHELRRQGTWSVALYPGFTDTDMSKPFQKGVKEGMIFPVDFTVGRMLDVVDRMEEKHSGGLYDWAGQALPF